MRIGGCRGKGCGRERMSVVTDGWGVYVGDLVMEWAKLNEVSVHGVGCQCRVRAPTLPFMRCVSLVVRAVVVTFFVLLLRFIKGGGEKT